MLTQVRFAYSRLPDVVALLSGVMQTDAMQTGVMQTGVMQMWFRYYQVLCRCYADNLHKSTKAQKLELCIQKQNYMTPIQYMVLKLSEN